MKLLISIVISAAVALFVSYYVVEQEVPTQNMPPIHATPHVDAYQRVMQSQTIRCGYVAWFPYYKKDLQTGEQTGISYEIMSAIGKELGLKVEWAEEVGWGNLGEGLKTGRYDAVCTVLWPDSGKVKSFTLSKPMFYTQLYPYVRENDARFDGHMELINKPDVKIAGIDGAFSYNIAKDNFPNAQIVSLPQMVSMAEFYLTVADGKADVLAAVDKDEIKEFMQNNPGKLRQVKDVPPVRVMPFVMMVGPHDDKLMEKINFGIDMLINNGVIANVLKKYSDSYLLPAPSYLKAQ